MSAIKISTCAPFSFSAAATALGTAKSYSRSTAMRTLLPGMVLLYPTNPMWLSRFSRQFASSRATGISLERSADRSPNRSSRSSFGTELLIPTPSSAVSHIEPPILFYAFPWVFLFPLASLAALREIGLSRFSNLSRQDPKPAKISSSLQTMFLHPIDDLDSLGEPDVGKRLGVLDRLIVHFARGRECHLAM